MENGLEILVSELQKQNQILQIFNQSAEEKTRLIEQKLIRSEEKVKKAEEEVKYLQFLYDQLKRMLFGAKRERFVSNADVNQMTLPFDVAQEPIVEQPVEKIEFIRKKASRENHHGRLDLPSHLPVEEVHLEPEQNTEGLKCIGQEVTSVLDYTPAKLFVRKYIRNKYALPGGEGILVADLPVRP